MLKPSISWQQARGHTLRPCPLLEGRGVAPLHLHRHHPQASTRPQGGGSQQHRCIRARASEDRQEASSFMRREEDPGRLEMAVPSDQVSIIMVHICARVCLAVVSLATLQYTTIQT
eukprot:792922-Pelagomonas_calceolata.AAC.1